MGLTKHHSMKTRPVFKYVQHYEVQCGSGVIAPRFLKLGARYVEWSDSHPGRFTPEERAPGTHFIGDWVSSRAG
jgi:hypothetical protein